MLSWLFKKPAKAAVPAAQIRPAPAAKTPPPVRATPAPKVAPAAEDLAEWAARVRAAEGDDAALLRLAQAAPFIDTKLAAVSALSSEGALRQAEREFRSHDRKVHRAAKQRLESAVTQREARATAQALLDRARGLLGEAQVPVNHLVELDNAWAMLPAQALEPAQGAAFAEVRAQLDTALRQHTDNQQRLQRWLADTKQLLPEWRRGLLAAAEHGGTRELDLLVQAVAACRQGRPDAPATAATDEALAALLNGCVLAEPRLAWFEAREMAATIDASGSPAGPAEEPAAAVEPPESLAPVEDVAVPAAPAPGPAQGWHDLPPLPDGELALALQRRHDEWQRLNEPVCPAPAQPVAKTPRPPKPEALNAEQRLRLEALVLEAETALVEGQFGEMQGRMQAIDSIMARAHASALPEHLRVRHQALWAERARLKDWQQWGGGRARDDLAAEAEALARSTLPLPTAAHAGMPAAPSVAVNSVAAGAVTVAAEPSEAAVVAAPERPKLNLKALGDSIQDLRKRWKELDHLGAAASGELWHRFDAALHTAHEPIAAQHAVLKAARQENLAAREAALTTLEGVAVPGDDATPDWRELLRELDRFQLAWRKLGPIEHTVPADARAALQQRLRAAVGRIEVPLSEARRVAAAVREQLIARAEAMTAEQGRAPTAAEATRRVRELQAEWQEHARQLSLPRTLENALWTRFRAAADAVFAQREAAVAARDVELAANLAAAEALIDRVAALTIETPEPEIRRTLAEADSAWRRGGEVPRGAIDGLEARYSAARAVAADLVAAGARHRWQIQCDALAARLALCAEREAGATDAAVLEQRWATQGALPTPWEQALVQRWTRLAASGPSAEVSVDERLLQFEAALGLPASADQQDARRQLKLRALKETMEGRAPARQGPATPADTLLALLRQGGTTPAQHARLHACVMALRQLPPASLGLPVA